MHIINASVHKMQTRTRSDSTRSSKLSSLHMVGEYGNHAQPAQESLPPDSHARQTQTRYITVYSPTDGCRIQACEAAASEREHQR